MVKIKILVIPSNFIHVCLKRSILKIVHINAIMGFLFLMYSTHVLGQTEGLIVDANNQSPLPGATIMLEDSTFTTSDIAGRFLINPVSYPTTVLASYIGYETTLVLLEKETTTLKIELK